MFDDFCLDSVEENWVLNDNDEYPDCENSIGVNPYDCNDECQGSAIEEIFYFDEDGDGFGDPNVNETFCNASVPNGWVINDTDECPYDFNKQTPGICGCSIADTDTDLDGFEDCIESCDEDPNKTDPGVCGCGVEDADSDEDSIEDCIDEYPQCFFNYLDCNDECGGLAFENECGCVEGSTGLSEDNCYGCTDIVAWNCPNCETGNDNATIDDDSCIYSPTEFLFNESQLQAVYYILEADIVSENLVELEDWIGIFYNDTCVGSAPWQGELTPIVAMGNDGTDLTNGYIEQGMTPSFKIYDSSIDEYLPAESQQDFGWQSNGNFVIESLSGNFYSTYNINLIDGANLVSFPVLPENRSIENVFSSLGENICSVISEGLAAAQLSPGTWVGSLNEIEYHKGYWLIMCGGSDNLFIEGFSVEPSEVVYDLHIGNNLIGFPFDISVDISTSIPDSVESFFEGIIGQGVAAQQVSPFTWVGSLSDFSGGDGYWVNLNDDMSFSFQIENNVRISNNNSQNDNPQKLFKYNQSTSQSFYFIESIEYSNINLEEYWLISSCNNSIVGSRKWTGKYTDLPVMGYDGNEFTKNYCAESDVPDFQLYNETSNKYLNLIGDIDPYSNNNISNVNLIVIEETNPNEYILMEPYPNPFNPSTTIEYSLNNESLISVEIIDMHGRLIDKVVNNSIKDRGIHSIVWNAQNYSSGVYFIRMIVNNKESGIKKILLVK